MDKDKFYGIFVYPAYVICFMGVLSVFSEIIFEIKTPDYMIGIFQLSAIWCLTYYFYSLIKAIWKS
jgi:hypothetical protein